jgi:uncharacterized protein YbaR (Trm112 family)
VPISKTLLNVLVCPATDHGSLVQEEFRGEAVLRCQSCSRRYPVDGSIPVLLLAHARDSEDESTPHHEQTDAH